MTEAEKLFKKTVEDKIEKYDIHYNGKKITFRDVLIRARNQFVMAHYQNGDPDELIDVGAEQFLYRCSPLLFLEKNAFFELPGKGEISCKKLYYFQKEILKDFINYKKIVLTKSRQTGLSTLTSLIFFWKIICFQSEWGVIISKDGKSASDVLSKIKTNIPHIPSWLGVKVIKNNEKGLSFSNKSKIDSFARSKSAGRGCSPTIALLDEAAFYQTASIIEGIVSSVVPSVAKSNGDLIIVSTPNGTQGEGEWYFKQVMTLQEKGGIDRTSRLYTVDWWEVPDEPDAAPAKGFNEKVASYVARDYFHHPEVKREANDFFRPIADNPKGNDWLYYQWQSSGEVKYRQEILQDFVVLGNSVFNKELLEKVAKKVKEPIEKDKCDYNTIKGFWVWEKPKFDHNYILSADISKGSGDDSSCIQVVDTFSYEQVAEYVGKCTTMDMAKYIYEIGQYYNFAYALVESNSIGEAVMNELYYNLNYPNLYKQFRGKGDIQVITGWMTSVKSREIITNNFIQTYNDDEMWKNYNPHSERLLNQMKTWVWKGGKPDHLAGAHDDTIMAMAIGLFNVTESLKHIRKENDMMFLDENGKIITAEEGKDGQLTKNYMENNLSKKEDLPESYYRNLERQMYRQAGIPEGVNQAEAYRWLLS